MKRIGTLRKLAGRAHERAGLACVMAMLLVASAAQAQQAGELITPNFRDADITQIAEAVSMATGKNFIIDPRVRAQVTMLSATPMSPDAFWEAFLSILQVHGFMASKSGPNTYQIVPDANARLTPSNDLPDRVNANSAEIVTHVIPVRNVSAAQLVPILRPLIPQQGHLAAYPAGNILIISDRANNVSRIMRIVQRIDQQGDSDVEVIPLQNASATELVRVVTSLYQAQGPAEGGVGPSPMKLVADERSNSVLVSGEPASRLRAKALIAHLDTPLEAGGDTRVRYLQYADAEKLAAKLKEQVTGIAQATPGAGGGGGGGQAAAPPSAQIDKSTTIWADPETNALVITAPPKVMKALMSVVDKLDIRRLQVLVEAVIVDVNLTKTAELGVNWAVFSNDDDTRIPIGGFLSPIGQVNLINLAQAVDDPSSDSAGLLGSGTTIGIGRIADSGTNFGAMIRALRDDTNANIIATPHAVTMDNQEAEIKIAREVPFITGQFTTSSSDSNNNPFQTIQRSEVGTILKITPQINSGDAVMMKIELESSNVEDTPRNFQASDIVTSKRTINTNVLIEDGGIIVLGGLIQQQYNRGESRVPFLGNIPIIGLAFKTRRNNDAKTNLMVFIRPKILRDGVQAAIETDAKYRYIREEQKKVGRRELLPLLPGVKPPMLPPPQPIPPAAPATRPPSEEDDGVKKEAQTKPAEQAQATAQPQTQQNPPPQTQPEAEKPQ